MMMLSENNIQLLPDILCSDNKMEDKPSKEDECDYYRQRFQSLKIVLDQVEKELALYKRRSLGVDTIELALKESKQQNVKLLKHTKSLEAAISILQKRLNKNGLSISINIQDTELFVPGASKQTLNNLAKENARLRTLLKQENGIFGKNSANEFEDIKAAMEKAESEISQLKIKIKDVEDVKLKMCSEYEEVIENLRKENQEEKARFEQELKAKETKQLKDEEKWKNENLAMDSSFIQDLKDLLSKTAERCTQLTEQLPISVTDNLKIQENSAVDESPRVHSVSQENFNKLETRLKEAITMNQRWQMYSKDREKQIQDLSDRLYELSDPNHEAAMVEEATKQKTAHLTMELNKKEAELVELHKRNNILIIELTDAKKWQSQSHQDSTVEILKQQIQVCTEDFNTERKDREKAVQKARTLQQENDRLKEERALMKKTIEQQQRQVHKPPSYETSLSSGYSTESPSPSQCSSQYSQPSSMRYQNMVPVQESPAEMLGPGPIPFSDYTGSPSPNTGVQDTVYRAQVTNPDMRVYGSMPRPATYVPGMSTPPLSNTSMPPLLRRGGNVKEELTCPKCNNKFQEDVLLSHIEACTQ